VVEGSIVCYNQQNYVELTITNQGDAPVDGDLYSTMRTKNPLTATDGLFEVIVNNSGLVPGASYIEMILVPAGTDTLYLVTNDDGSLPTPFDLLEDFPFTNIYECNYQNNIIVLPINNPTGILDLGPDQTVCDNGVTFLSADEGWDEYRWQDGQIGPTYTAVGPGTYWVTATKECYSKTDTIIISLDETTMLNLEDQVICEGDSLVVSLTGFDTYQWSPETGIDCSTCASVNLFPQDTQLYRVIARNNAGCYSVDSILVTPLVPTFTEMNVSICLGETLEYEGVELSPGSIQEFVLTSQYGCDSMVTVISEAIIPLSLPYEVTDVSCFGDSDGTIQIDTSLIEMLFSLDGLNYSSTSNFTDLPAGDYIVYGQDEFGCVSETFVIVDTPDPLYLGVSPDTSVVLGCPVTVRSYTYADGPLFYQWQPETMMVCDTCPASITIPYFTTDYQLVITDENGCTASDITTVTVNKPRPIYIPNAFSPNGDGENDVFMIYSDKEVEEVVSFRIYNRWGALVFADEHFAPNDPAHGWNGYFKSEKMNPGVFVYIAEILFLDGVMVQFSGDVSLLL